MSGNFYAIRTIFRNVELPTLKTRFSGKGMDHFIAKTQVILASNHLTDAEKIDSIVMFIENLEDERDEHRRTIPASLPKGPMF